jgi:hypothetical protein
MANKKKTDGKQAKKASIAKQKKKPSKKTAAKTAKKSSTSADEAKNASSTMIFSITYYNDFDEPYIYDKPETLCRHVSTDSYSANDVELAKTIVKDILDAPIAELSLESIKHDFGSRDYPLTEEAAVAIKDYYNGRYALYQAILDDMKTFVPRVLHYDIPQKYNTFSIEDNTTTKQISAYIEITIGTAAIS